MRSVGCNLYKLIFLIAFSFQAQIALGNNYSYRYRTDWFNSYLHKRTSSALVEDKWNDVYTDLRFDYKLTYENISFVIRPRVEGQLLNHEFRDIKERHIYANVPEGFISLELTPDFFVSLGRQSFQWGPAELVSWSNSFFHFNYNYRSFFHLENGKYLSRVNYSYSRNTTMILLMEHKNEHFKEDYENFILNYKYKAKYLGKIEYASDRAQDYLGLTYATGEGRSQHAGFYGAYGLSELFSIYTDSRFSFKNSYYKLTTRNNAHTWILEEDESKKIFPLVSAGARFEDTFDLRFEYIYNSLGLKNDELEIARNSINPYLNVYGSYNQAVLQKSGREFLGRNYFYTSLRIPNLTQSEDMTIYLRQFISLQDYSFTFQFNTEKNLTQNMVGYLETDSAFGPKDSEMKMLSTFSGRIGFKYSF